MAANLDNLLAHLGTGGWSYMHLAFISHSLSLPVYQAMAGAFQAPKVGYWCTNTDSENPYSEHGEFNQSFYNRTERFQCSYPQEDPVTGKVEYHECTEWGYDNSTFSSTATSEFDLVCDREYLRAMYTSLYMFGIFIGAPINGILADKYGRRPLIVYGGIAFIFLGIISTWLPYLLSHMAARFLLGLMLPNVANTGYIMAIEIAEPRHRTVLGIVLYLPWALGMMAYGGVAYLIRDWRMLQLTCSMIGVIMLPGYWFMDESPRWLMVKGRHEEALKILKKAAKGNKVSLPPEKEVLALLQEEVPAAENTPSERNFKTLLKDSVMTVLILFKTPKLRLITLILYLDYLVLTGVYYGLSLNGGNLSNNPFIYMVLSGLMEVPSYTLASPIIAKFGRRGPTVLCCLACGVALVVLAFVPQDYSWLIMTLAMLGKMTIAVSFQISNLYSSELFPTEVRSRGIGTCTMMSRIGSMCSPFITEFLGSRLPWAPSIVFGVASLIIGFATLSLPETLNVALPDTIAALEARDSGESQSLLQRLCCKIPKSQPKNDEE